MACRGLEQCCSKDWTPEGSFFYQPVEMAWEGIKEKFGDGAIPLPPFWGGYRVLPETIEFWQGGVIVFTTVSNTAVQAIRDTGH